MDKNSTPGERIKQLREEKHLTQKEIAESIHCHVKHYSAMENGKRSVTRETANAIAHLFGVDEEWILCEMDYRTNAEKRAALEGKLFDIITKSDSVERLIESHGYEINYVDDIDSDGFIKSYSVEIRGNSGRCLMNKKKYAAFKKNINDIVEGLLLLEIKRDGEANG